jgi:fructosamine-3-kinase
VEVEMFENIPDAVQTFLTDEKLGLITAVSKVTGGNINQINRLETSQGRTFILKQTAEKQERLFSCEADGLQALRKAGMRTPDVLAVGDDFLLLEDLGDQTDREPDWAAFGRAVAHQHLHTNERFGYSFDNYLGPLPQINTWMDSGHEFFGQYRVLRYLSEPLCEQAMTVQDRQDLERLVDRLPDLVPEQKPSLLHGDLWHTNMMVDSLGMLSVIDPAVYYGWPEAELSQTRLYGNGKVTDDFYAAYNEVNPLVDGWWERLELLTIRQLVAVLAFFGDQYNTLAQLRELIDKYR